MKTFYSFLLCLILSSQLVTAQWYMQPSGTTENLKSVYFINQNTGWVCGTNGIIKKTTDGGLSWIEQYTNSTDNLKSIQFANVNNGWAIGDTSIYTTNNGGTTWYYSSSSLNLVGQQFFHSGAGFIGWRVLQDFMDIMIYKYYVGWYIQGFVPAGYCNALFFIDENNGWITSVSYRTIFRTTNGGSDWEAGSASSILESPTCVRFATPLVGWVTSNSLSHYNISKSTDGGANWFSQVTGGLNEFVNSISSPDPSTAYAVGFHLNTPPAQNDGFIIKTGNGGTNWEEQYRDEGKLNSVFFVDENKGWAVGDGGKILATTNGGIPVEFSSFTAHVVQNEKAVQLNWATATETNNSGFEVLRSIENDNWVKLGFVYGQGTTTETQNYSFKDNNVMPGNYQYRLKQIDNDGSFEYSQIIDVEIPLVSEFLLLQNFPNPYNPTTKIQYAIGSQRFVTLKIYDVLGNEITTLVNEEKPAGRYELTWTAAALPSGVYFYQLRAGAFVEMKKMILAK